MVRFSDIVIAYFVIGTIMYGGGAVEWQDAGVPGWFVEQGDDGEVQATQQTEENLDGIGGALKTLVDAVVGPILIIWDIVSGLVGFIHWPILVLTQNNAPPILTILLGGGFTSAFYLSMIRLLRTSA